VPRGAKRLAPHVGHILECGRGVAAGRAERHRAVGAGFLEQQRLVGCRGVAVSDRRQRFNVHFDQRQRILGDCGTIREHERERFADVAHLGLRDHRLAEAHEVRQRLQPHGNAWHRPADVFRGDHALHAGEGTRRRGIDRTKAAVGDGAAQHRRVQHALARKIVDILPAPAQETQVFQPLDRAADERVDRLHTGPFCL
jgi:hypothetical protein